MPNTALQFADTTIEHGAPEHQKPTQHLHGRYELRLLTVYRTMCSNIQASVIRMRKRTWTALVEAAGRSVPRTARQPFHLQSFRRRSHAFQL